MVILMEDRIIRMKDIVVSRISFLVPSHAEFFCHCDLF